MDMIMDPDLPCARNCSAFNEGCYSQSCGKQLHASFRQFAVMVGMITASTLVALVVIAILSS